ncbi:hypothetical protein [Pantoea allii]|uniref:hypothetical protein n=1 Tax=Pantoea allii TaxID=574096 RepID=UPI0024B7E3CC|nr:hypothetical protein [Pantoea allii]MDJ0087668.1 hypothetical protein [Pantoea allii]
MDLSRTIIPKSDQINFEDVQTISITATIKSVRAGNKEQPVFIDLEGYEGRPYKPSLSMRRVLVGGWGNDGKDWVGKSLTLVGDPNVKFGGVKVGGIKVKAMSGIESNFSMMLSVSRGKRVEHFVERLVVDSPPVNPLMWFTANAGSMDLTKLSSAYERAKSALAGDDGNLNKLAEVYKIRKSEIEGQQ